MFAQGNLVSSVNVSAGNKYDLNKDLRIDNTDADDWLAKAAAKNGYSSPFRRGDTDDVGPGTTDITDFGTLASNFIPVGDGDPTNGPFWDQANFDGDDDVDITDFGFVAGNFSATGYGPTNVVPEPSSVVLILFAILGAMHSCRKRQ